MFIQPSYSAVDIKNLYCIPLSLIISSKRSLLWQKIEKN